MSTEMAPPQCALEDFYCAGCNERFLHHADEPFCPRCGMLAATDQLADPRQPTLLWRSTDASAQARSESDLETAQPEDLRSLLGQRLGPYQVDQFLGRGGMGWVFLAHHAELQRPCALKILSPHLARRDPDYLTRFRNEGRASAALMHPNVVATHAIGEIKGLHFLEMEFVAGRTLQHVIRDHRLSLAHATTVALGVASGLAEAHRAGLIHRDVKPDNVLISLRGKPKIGDFGLAKRVAGDNDRALAGTPHFMAPELFQGEPASPSSDVYALGVVYFQMLTGRLPFARDTLNALMAAVTSDPAPDIRRLRHEVPLEMAECLGMLLDKSPANRPADAVAAFQLLDAVLGHLRDLDGLLHEALDDEPGVTWRKSGEQYEVQVLLEDGRSQRVVIHTEAGSLDGQVVLYSVCCSSRADFYEDALRLNAQIGNGALAVHDIDGVPHFVVINAYPRSTVDAEEIRRSVRDLADHADSVERRLTNQDLN